jgi:hypothetical protein
MLDEPQIVRTDTQQTAIIELTIAREEIQSVMGPGMAEVMAAVTAQGMAPAGPIFAHHLRPMSSAPSRAPPREPGARSSNPPLLAESRGTLR